MLNLLRRLLLGPPTPKTRMTREEVMALAAKAASAAKIKESLGRLTVRQIDGRLTWFASTPTVGSGWSVRIDDETGEVGPVRRWGIR
jgi:hypothetical protein